MKLYNYYRSSTSFRIRIALNLKGQAFEYVPVNLKTGEQKEAAFASLNPHQSLPVLDAGEQKLTQSLAILDWLEATYPEPSFLPADPALQQTCRELYYAIATEIHAPNNLSVLKYLRTTFNADPSAIEAWYQTWVHRTFMPVEQRLQTMQWASPDLPFGAPGLFEIVLVPQIYNAQRWSNDLGPFPDLVRIHDHCLTLPAFRAAHPDAQPDAIETNA